MISRLITFEGGEGVGKSTQIRLLGESLRKLGHEVIETREPGGTPLSETIRAILKHDTAGESPIPAAETLLFQASRAQLVEKVILPALKRGAWVLSDRFYDSTYAYQGYGRGYDLSALRAITEFAIQGAHPGTTFLLTIPPETQEKRIKCRGGAQDRMEREAKEFHARVRDGYEKLAQEEPRRIITIDTSSSIEETQKAIWEQIKARYL